MPELEVWRCQNCGGDVQIDAVDRAGVYHCGYCGAMLTAPAAALGPVRFEVHLEDAGSFTVPLVKILAEKSSLAIAAKLVRQAPCVVLTDASRESAEALQQQLVAAGARASVVQTGGPAAARVRPPPVPDPLVLGGTWSEGTVVEARRPDGGTLLASAKTSFASLNLRIPTSNTPVPVCLWIRTEGEPPRVIHHNHELTRSRSIQDVFLPLVRTYFEACARVLDIALQPGTGILVLRARRDETTPDLEGVSFTTWPALPIAYVDERGGFNAGQQTTTKYGCAMAFNVPPGTVRAAASHGGQAWREASVPVEPDTITEIAFWR